MQNEHHDSLMILFGSRARNTAGASSDADVAVLDDHPLKISEKGEWGTQAARMLGTSEDSVDVVDLWNAPPLLQHRVAEEGKLLRGSSAAFIRFRTLAWRRYLDTAKFRRARERALLGHHDA